MESAKLCQWSESRAVEVHHERVVAEGGRGVSVIPQQDVFAVGRDLVGESLQRRVGQALLARAIGIHDPDGGDESSFLTVKDDLLSVGRVDPSKTVPTVIGERDLGTGAV